MPPSSPPTPSEPSLFHSPFPAVTNSPALSDPHPRDPTSLPAPCHPERALCAKDLTHRVLPTLIDEALPTLRSLCSPLPTLW